MTVKWDKRFLELAEHIARWSKDPSTQTGAVIVRPDKTIASVGFNGFPKGMKDTKRLYDNRETKYSRIIHCEMNAIINANEDLTGYTLYNWPGQSCDRCAVHVIQAGIKKVVYPNSYASKDFNKRWASVMEQSNSYFEEAGVNVVCL